MSSKPVLPAVPGSRTAFMSKLVWMLCGDTVAGGLRGVVLWWCGSCLAAHMAVTRERGVPYCCPIAACRYVPDESDGFWAH
jgi:hypothetical protein